MSTITIGSPPTGGISDLPDAGARALRRIAERFAAARARRRLAGALHAANVRRARRPIGVDARTARERAALAAGGMRVLTAF